MISLSKHIEILLLEHDCVIVPGLGGFIANQASARIDDNDEHNILPPYRTIGFNSELSVNDGLLVQSYMQAYDAAYPEALLQMEKDINQMTIQLDTIGSYTFEGIGTLCKNIDGSLSFTAIESGILTPSLYGLYSIIVKSVEEAKKDNEIKKSLNQISILPIQTESKLNDNTEIKKEDTVVSKEQKKEENLIDNNKKHGRIVKNVVNLKPNWKEFSVAVSVTAILFFLFQFPSLKSGNEFNDTVVASSIYLGNPCEMGVAPSNKEITTVTKPTAYKSIADKIVEKNSTTNNNNTTESQQAKSSVKNPNYVIVLASCVSAKNAKAFIKDFEKEGFNEARFVEGKINRVHYSGYSSYNDAVNALTKLKSENSSFKNAWVLRLN